MKTLVVSASCLLVILVVAGCGETNPSGPERQPPGPDVTTTDNETGSKYGATKPDEGLLELLGSTQASTPLVLDQSTPEAVFRSHVQANIAMDWKAALDVLTPEIRVEMLRLVVFQALIAASEDVAIANLMNKHGIDAEEVEGLGLLDRNRTAEQNEALTTKVKNWVDALVDPSEFYAEIMVPMVKIEALSSGMTREEVAELQAATKLVDVEVIGNTAQGTQVIHYKDLDNESLVTFELIDGKWYVNPFAE